MTSAVTLIFLSVVGAAIVSGVMAVRTQKAASETRAAYSLSDFRTAVSHMDSQKLSGAIAHLTHSLRTEPENQEAAMLLRSTLKQHPLSSLLLEKRLVEKSVRVAFFTSDDGSSLVVSETGRLIFFDPQGNPVAEPEVSRGTNHSSAISQDRSLVAISNIQGDFLLVDLFAQELREIEQIPDSLNQYYFRIAFSSSSEKLVMGSQSGRVHLWDTESGKVEWNWEYEPGLSSLVFCELDRKIAVAGRDGKVIELNAETGEVERVFEEGVESIHTLVDSKSGYRYYPISDTGIVYAVDAGRFPRDFTPERVETPLLLTDADPSRRLTAYAAEKEMSIWTVKGRTIIRRFPLSSQPASILIHPADSLAFVATKDEGIYFWPFDADRQAGTEIARARNTRTMLLNHEENLLRSITVDGVLRVFRLPDTDPESGIFKSFRRFGTKFRYSFEMNFSCERMTWSCRLWNDSPK